MESQNKFYLVHFIENHTSNINLNLNIFDNNQNLETEIISTKNIKKNNINYTSVVYCIKIPASEIETIIQLKEENNEGSIYEKKLSNKEYEMNDKKKYIFLFGIEFKNISNSESSKMITLEMYEEFQIYLQIFREKYNISRETEENDDLIRSLKKFVFGNTKKFDFFLYIAILSEIFYSSTLFYPALRSFIYENLLENTNPDEEKIKKSKDIINKYFDELELILKNIKENLREKAEEKLNMIILYFYYLFQKEKFYSILKSNKKEKFNKIISDHHSFFPTFFPKVNEFTNETKNVDEIKKYLLSIENCFELVNIIYFNIEHILNKYKEKLEELKKMKNNKDSQIQDIYIQMDNYIGPNNEDDLNKILQIIQEILKYELKKNVKFINFSPKYFENFVKFSYENNLDNLIFLKNIIDNFLKKIDNSFKINDLDEKIHRTGIKLINDNVMNNFQILDFIENDIFYSNKIYESSKERDLNILKKLNIEEIKEDFIEKWKKIKLGEICQKQEEKLFNILCSLITKFSQIDLLIKLLYENDQFDKRKTIKVIVDTFNKKFINQKKELSSKYEIFVNLIKYLDKNQFQLDEFFSNLDKNLLLDIILNTLKTKYDISTDSLNSICDFIEIIAKNAEHNMLQKIFSVLNEDNNRILNKLTRFEVEDKDFLKVEETFKLKLFKELLSRDYFSQKGENNIFINMSLKNLESIKYKFSSGSFTYNELYNLLNEENNDTFLKRICLLYLIKDSDIDLLKKDPRSDYNKICILMINMINQNFNERKKIIQSLELILKDLNYFFPISCKNEIEELENYINKIKNKYLNVRIDKEDNDNIKDYYYYKSHFLQKAEERASLINSIIFNKIYEEEKLTQKNDEELILDKAKLKFKELGEIFNENNNDSNPLYFKYIKLFNNTKNDEIIIEIKNLASIFKFDIEEKEIEKIIDKLILLKDRDKILSIARALIIFIKKTNVEEEEYTGIINGIIESINEELERECINMGLDLLKTLGVDLNDKRKENYFPNVLLKMTQKPEIIEFLINRNNKDIKLFKEIENNNDNKLLTKKDIIGFEKCVEFMNKIVSPEGEKNITDNDLVHKAISLSENNFELEIYLNNFIEHFEQIKEFINKNEIKKN